MDYFCFLHFSLEKLVLWVRWVVDIMTEIYLVFGCFGCIWLKKVETVFHNW